MIKTSLISAKNVIVYKDKKPIPDENEVLIKIMRVGICGSDIHAYYGKHPYISFPIVQGHEVSGYVEEKGANVSGYKIGEKVTIMPQVVCNECLNCKSGRYNICDNLMVIGCQTEGASQEFLCVNSRLIKKLPDTMCLDYGVMVEPASVAIGAVKKAGDINNKNILILGAGTIGNLTAQIASILNARKVLITDVSNYRLEIAKKCGIPITCNIKEEPLEKSIAENFGNNGADLIIECVGSEATIEQAINIARKGTDIIVVGVFGQKVNVSMGLVQDKELRIIGSLMYLEDDYNLSIELINKNSIILDPLITKHFDLEEVSNAYKYIEINKEKTMKIILDVN